MTAIRCLSKYALGTQLFVLTIWQNHRRKSEKHEKLNIYAFDFRLLPTIVQNCNRFIDDMLCRIVRPTFERQPFISISSRTLTIEV